VKPRKIVEEGQFSVLAAGYWRFATEGAFLARNGEHQQGSRCSNRGRGAGNSGPAWHLMKLPVDTIIARAKLTDYLLRPRDDHDKSGFLAVAGYTGLDADHLEADMRVQLLPLEAAPAGVTV